MNEGKPICLQLTSSETLPLPCVFSKKSLHGVNEKSKNKAGILDCFLVKIESWGEIFFHKLEVIVAYMLWETSEAQKLKRDMKSCFW